MPRYLVQRRMEDVSEEELMVLVRKAKEVLETEFTDVSWEHSHVVASDDGAVTSYCIYDAPNPDRLREHGAVVGNHVIQDVYEIFGDINPAEL